MKLLITIFFLVICSSCAESISSQQTNIPQGKPIASSIPDGWVLYPDSEINSSTLQCANYSRREWRVEQSENNVKIHLDKLQDHQAALPDIIRFRNVEVGTKGYRSVEQVADGWLVGLDVGEFGGGLWWFSSDGKANKKLSAENIVGFAKTSTGVLAFTGLAHLGFDNGKVLKVVGDTEANRKIETLVDLGCKRIARLVTCFNNKFIRSGKNIWNNRETIFHKIRAALSKFYGCFPIWHCLYWNAPFCYSLDSDKRRLQRGMVCSKRLHTIQRTRLRLCLHIKRKMIVNERRTQQFNGREGETATFFWRFLVNSELRGGGFAPRHLSRYVALGEI
jgi:hypothetical protein